MKSKDLDFQPIPPPRESKDQTSNVDSSTDEHTKMIFKYSAHNVFYMPIIMHKGEGAHLYDINGRKYLDFLAAFSSVNQGHCNPKIREAYIR
jgi:ornithine--oxo-acid transaminase